MKLIVKDDEGEVGEWAAAYIKMRIETFAPTAERPFVLGLPTGHSPLPMYRRLVRYAKAGELSFAHVVTFNLDEYVGLGRLHQESYHRCDFPHASRYSCAPPGKLILLLPAQLILLL